MESFCPPSGGGDSQVVGYYISSASLDAGAESGGCRKTIAARIVADDVGRFATWKLEYV